MTMNTSRIPLSLQAVFLASNRGKDVHKPPPEKVATKTFTRNWMFQGLMTGNKRRAKRQERLQKAQQFSNKQEHPAAPEPKNQAVVVKTVAPVAPTKTQKVRYSSCVTSV